MDADRRKPSEIADPIPFAEDDTHRAYDREHANRFWRVLVQAERVFKEFRAQGLTLHSFRNGSLGNEIALPTEHRGDNVMPLRCIAILAAALTTFTPAAMRADDAGRGQSVAVNGIQMHYEVRGEGRPLVMLHGFMLCGEVWGSHLDRLAEHYRLIVPDLRAHGRSTNPSGGFTLPPNSPIASTRWS